MIEKKRLTFRFHVVTDCLAGCLISVLLSIFLMLKFDSTAVGLIPMIIVPPLSVWLGGVRRRDSLLLIAVLGLVGWFAGAYASDFVFDSQARVEGQAELSLVGIYSIVSSAIGSGVFALAAAFFIGKEKLTTFGKSKSNLQEP